MRIGRRQALSLLGCAALTGLRGPERAAAKGIPKQRARYLGVTAAADGRYRLSAIGRDGARAFETALPGRGHGIAAHPRLAEAVVFARRPGTFALVLALEDGAERARLVSPPGRHFFGHGAYSGDGALLFTTENDFDAGRGVIGVWDATDRYRRVAEMASHGIGPHEIVLAPDGRTLIVANGGILTHPDTGRRKLNVPTMNPSLAYIDPRDGRLLETRGFDAPRHRLLSIRHLALGAGGVVCVALQDEGPRGERMPLVAFHRRGEPELDLHAAPRPVARRMQGYAGSAAADSAGRTVAVSAPRGDLITVWDVRRRAFLGAVALRDGCGVAAAGGGGFLATSGAGGAVRFGDGDGRAVRIAAPFPTARHWDNHLVAVSPRI